MALDLVRRSEIDWQAAGGAAVPSPSTVTLVPPAAGVVLPIWDFKSVHSALLHAHLCDDPKRLTAVAVALVTATAEEHARQSLGSQVVGRYLDAIERLGYQPTDWEHSQRLTTAA